MPKQKNLFLPASFLILIVFFLFGCQQENSIVGPEPIKPGLSKFSLPSGATLTSATLNIHEYLLNGQEIKIHRVTSPWDEMTVTWGNFSGAFDATPSTSFLADTWGWRQIDITNLVNGWLKGDYPNYGLLLDQEIVVDGWAQWSSKEWTSNHPYLELTYSTSNGTQTVTMEPIGDAYIYELNPTQNYGSSPWLYTGWTFATNKEKQSLIQFDLEPTHDGGCTLTPGYWQTHSKYGPAPYDNTWEQVGEDTPFFLSGKSYYQTLRTSPAGNAYYILSFHYIAAKLNQLNGADFSSAQAAFDEATVLFQTYTPAQIAALKGSNALRQKFISLAGILGSYNEGYIGPGHCD